LEDNDLYEESEESISEETITLEETVRGAILEQTTPAVPTNPWLNLTFSWTDLFNIPLGSIQGAMGAIPSL
jgi:hypothetical protein